MPKNSEPTIGLYPASFDPITVAHVSIAERAARLLDHVYVAVAINPAKKYLFELEKKVELVEQSIGHIANASSLTLEDGITVDHAKELGARTLIRGARSVTDFLDEIDLFGQNLFVQNAIGINSTDDEFVDTQTYYALPGQDHISSSLVRGLMGMAGVTNRAERIKPLVPAPVFAEILTRLESE
jgi:pantetheine-phosphate adenylyltransferase